MPNEKISNALKRISELKLLIKHWEKNELKEEQRRQGGKGGGVDID